MRKIVSIGLATVLAALIGGFFWWQWATGAVAPETKNSEVIFVVKKGDGVKSIAEKLQQEKLVRSPLVFRVLVVREGLTKKIQAGDFRLNRGMTTMEIIWELTHGTLDIWITIPEGWRREQIAEAISSQFTRLPSPGSEATGGQAVHSSQFLEETQELEGRLFPDTYLIPKGATAEMIVNVFLENFDKKFDSELRQETERQGLTVDQVLTLASLIEREVKTDQDRPIVAGLLFNRLEAGMALQIDATVQYSIATRNSQLVTRNSINWWPKNLIKEDLKIDSPYNTYINKGLPPGPICNPGLASIKAVIYPQTTDYWYYLSDSQGQIHYAVTYEEHLENVRKFLFR